MVLLLALACVGANALDSTALPNPLKNVKEGQWVVYKVLLMGIEAEQKQSIVAIEGEGEERVLTMKIDVLMDGEVVQSDEQKVTYSEAVREMLGSFDDAKDAVFTAVKAQVGEREIDAVQVDFTEDGVKCLLQLSESVPIVGIVKMEIEGFDGTVMEVVDFGE